MHMDLQRYNMSLNLNNIVREITAASVESAADAVYNILASKATYPDDHKAGMRVPKGGSSCASCEYLGKDKKSCTNKHFIKWHGSDVLPAPADEYCSDWYEHEDNDIDAGGPGSGRHPELYHGTSVEMAEGIIKNGLEKQPVPKDSGALIPGGVGVFTTKDKEVALGYSLHKGSGDVALVILKQTAPLSLHPGNDYYYISKDSIAPKHIDRIEIFDRKALEKASSAYPAIQYPKPKRILKAASETSLSGDQKGTLWNGIKIIGFTGPQEEGVRAMLSRVPPELLFNVTQIESAKQLGAKHGRYVPESKVMMFNPENFNLRQRFGKGDHWILHPELTVVHEIGHSVYESLSTEKQKEWQDLSGWMKGWKVGQSLPYQEKRPGWGNDKSKWTHKAGIKFTRHYAERNANEDFADCFAFCLLGKGHQMELSKREFMENLFKEYVKGYVQVNIQSPSKPYAERSPTPPSPLSDKTGTNLYNNINAGGPGSGRHATGRKDQDRADRAKASYVAQTRERFRIASLNEGIVAAAIGGVRTGMIDGKWYPFDVVIDKKGKLKTGVEVKTILPGAKNNKLTMHKPCLIRKRAEAIKGKYKQVYTVAVDMRTANSIGVYYKKGLGSFQLGSMTDVGSFANLKKYIKG